MATISKADIGTGNTIQAEHITRIIDALNGTGSADVIATGSFTGSFNGFADTWTVQDLTVFGTASINYFETIYETSSIIYQSGSTKFGNSADDTHQFTGSVFIDGDVVLIGNTTASGSFTGSFIGDGSGLTGVVSSSYAVTASYANNALSAINTPNAVITASNTGNDDTIEFLKGGGGAFSVTVNNVVSSSYALTASYAENAGADTNFANTNLTFTGTRTHDLSGNSLSLLNGGSIILSGSGGFNEIQLKHDTNTFSLQSIRTSFNPGNADIDFRVGSVGTDYALNVDGGTDRVSINKNFPNATLDVNGDTIITGSLTSTGLTEGAGTNTVAMYNTGSGQFYYTSSAAIGGGGGGSDTNFANTDLTLDDNRTHDLNGFRLIFEHASAAVFSIGSTTGVNVNAGQADRDFRVDTQGDTRTLFVEGSSDRVGVGKNTPNAKLDVNGNAIITGSLTISSSLSTEGAKVRKYRTITLTDADYSTVPSDKINADDDIILVINNTTGAPGVGEANFGISSFLASPSGRCVEIVCIKSGSRGILLSDPDMVGLRLWLNDQSQAGGYRQVCSDVGESITLMSYELDASGSAWGNGY
jgi:hypothetical protein